MPEIRAVKLAPADSVLPAVEPTVPMMRELLAKFMDVVVNVLPHEAVHVPSAVVAAVVLYPVASIISTSILVMELEAVTVTVSAPPDPPAVADQIWARAA